MSENTEGGSTIRPRPRSSLRSSAPLVGAVVSLGLFVSSVIGFASVGHSLDEHVDERPVIDGPSAVIVSDDELCFIATSLDT